MSRWIHTALLAGLLPVWLVACTPTLHDDLTAWMSEQRSTVRPRVEPIAEPAAYVPSNFIGLGAVSPFSEDKLTVLLRAQAASPSISSLIATELNRRKEPLELVPLDTLSMVGLLNRGAETVALVRSDNLLHQIRVGNHLGQNYGRVTRITETQITLREIVQDAAGEWIERTTTLQLHEGARQ